MFTLRDTQALFGCTGVPPRACPGWRGQHRVAKQQGWPTLVRDGPGHFGASSRKSKQHHLSPNLHGDNLLRSSPARARSRYFDASELRALPLLKQSYLNTNFLSFNGTTQRLPLPYGKFSTISCTSFMETNGSCSRVCLNGAYIGDIGSSRLWLLDQKSVRSSFCHFFMVHETTTSVCFTAELFFWLSSY